MRKYVYKIIFLTIVVLILAVTCSRQAPIDDSFGNPIRLSDYHGKWVLINYWAAWCGPCLKEMPALNRLCQRYKNQVVVLGVNFDHLSNDQLQKLKQRFAINYPVLSQFPIETVSKDAIDVVPTTFIINPQGKLFAILKGPQTDQQLIQQLHLQGK